MVNDCWNQIGIWGERTCRELATVKHCYSCPIYTDVGRGLLERDVPPGYLEEWTELLAIPRNDKHHQFHHRKVAVIIFRLGQEWMALPAHLFEQVTPPRVVHTLPHRSNQILRGIVNIRGNILLCVSLHHLLGVSSQSTNRSNDDLSPTSTPLSPVVYQRMIVMKRQGETWVAAIDELYGVQTIHLEELQATPAVVAKETETYIQGIIPWHSGKVNYLDEKHLFETLNQQIL